MGIAFTVAECSLITGLFIDTNLWVIYISLVVVFFLIGLILGLSIGTRKRLPREERAPENNDSQSKPRQGLIPGQENKELQQIYNTSQGHHSRHKRHKHPSIHI